MIPAVPGYPTGRSMQDPGRGITYVNTSMPPVEVTRRIMRKKSLETVRRPMYVRSITEGTEEEDGNEDLMHHVMCPVLVVAQCFALCPVQGITARKAEQLRFTWWSLRVLYSIVVILALCVANCFVIVWFTYKGLTFNASASLVFHFTGMLCCLLFLRLAWRWPTLVLLWQQVERSQVHYGYPKKLNFKVKLMMTTLLFVALVEYLLGHAHSALVAWNCAGEDQDVVKLYFRVAHPQIFEVVPFNAWLAVFSAAVNLVGAFYWSFADLFIMIISVILASRFQLLNNHLRLIIGKEMPEGFWRESREDYNSLSYLTKTLDQSISGIVLLSFATNLFYICQQLFNSMKYPINAIAMAYFYVSFGYLLTRTIAVSLCAASVHDESKKVKYVLYAVPPRDYRVEVHRFLVQIFTDDIALTGLNFFPVTRTLLLTLAGTVVTYEVVLVQFGSSDESTITNMTVVCKAITGY